ncbi:hypothetical protein B0H11DRAFT_1905767 [Mycena galericulata]|nr:hypothetical protein B0H11DRAFT_1905767 [Mycena galericulata]
MLWSPLSRAALGSRHASCRTTAPLLPPPPLLIPAFFRAYCTRSGCVFDEESGFLAQDGDKIFDPSNNVATAKEILTNHLEWSNHHIPSPLISVSTSREKPRRLSGAMRRYHGANVEVFIAEIIYDVKPSSAYHMMSTAGRLGVNVSRNWVDHEEYVFSGHIPLEHVVKIEQVADLTVEWTNEGIPVQVADLRDISISSINSAH